MSGEKASVANAATKTGKVRQRSTIGFPYMDLNSAIELAVAIHEHVGSGECDDDQLAAWSDQSAKASTFRVQVYAARTFGVLEGEGAKHKLSELGRQIVDPNQSRAARARAFLTVPLYKAIYNKFRGGVLPPAAALEREIAVLGVSEKQKERARQIFERSAEQAGFSEHGKNRLVMPGVTPGSPPPKDRENNGGSGGSGEGPNDALIQALIQKLPKSGPWSADERVNWLKLLTMAFQIAYGPDEAIEIKKEAAN
jgi:hypothetical protein